MKEGIEMDNILSTTIRCVGEKNNLNNFLKGIDLISKSKFNNANFNFCEIQELLDDDNFEIEFKTLLKEFNKLNYTVAHAPIHWPFLFNEYYNLDYQKLENRINKSIKLASLLNIKNIVMHIGTKLNSDGTYNLKESVKENIKYLEPFVFLAENLGIKIAIENGTQMQKDAPQFNDTAPYIDELIEITDYYNNLYKKEVVGICFDFGHANVGKLNIYDEIIKIGKRLIVTHIHDNYGTDTHNFPYRGTINWQMAYKALCDINYTGELTLEVRYNDYQLRDFSEINLTYDILKSIINYKDKCINYAHRGASSYAPENTFSSFDLGIKMMANGIETDLQITKDKKIVIFHDDVLDNRSNCKGKIKDYTYDELLKYDFGSWFGDEYKNTRIVLFEDFAKKYFSKDLTFAIELKESGFEKEVLDIINKYKTHNNYYISSFKYDALENIYKIDKNVKTSWLIMNSITDEVIKKAEKINLSQICPNASIVDEKQVALANLNNFGVRIWGVTDTSLMEKVYRYNIEGMTVNFPDKLYSLINKGKEK
jgi:glycerophosphoryl diester phosphodiesterase